MNHLTLLLLTAMLAWSPLKEHPDETPEVARERYASIATDIAETVEATDEPALFADDEHKYKTALLVLSVARWESRFTEYVDSGKCNDRIWRKSHERVLRRGDCDGGHAFSIWQIHPKLYGRFIYPQGDTIAFVADGYRGADIIKERKLAAKIALRMIRESMKRSHGTLCQYTGEFGKVCPKARSRYESAEAYWLNHPWKEENDATP